MTAPPVVPGPSRRDAQIAQLLDKGLSIDRIAELGYYQGSRTTPAWTRADVQRLLWGRDRPAVGEEADPRQGREPSGQPCRCRRTTTAWSPPNLPGQPSTVVLTPRQAQVLDGLCEALDARAICARLGIADGTVRSHVKALLAAFGVNDRTQLVALALSGRFAVEVADDRREAGGSNE